MAKFLKRLITDELRQMASEVEGCVLVDFRGLTAKESNELRRLMREQDVRMNVVPNRLYRRAVTEILDAADGPSEARSEAIAEVLRGPTAVVFGGDGAVTAAKVVTTWLKNHEKPEIKGGLLDRQVIDVAAVQELAKIPSREELLSQIVGLIAEPMRRIVGALDSAVRNIVYALDAIVEQKKQS